MVASWFSQPFWSLPLPLPLPLWPPLSLPLFLPFFPPFRGKILTFLGCNGEKRSILGQGGIIRFGAFGWAFAHAREEGLPFTGPSSKPAYTVRGGGDGAGGAAVEEDGSVGGGPGCMPIGRATTAGIRYVRGRWWSIAQRGRSERGTGDSTGSGRVRKTS